MDQVFKYKSYFICTLFSWKSYFIFRKIILYFKIYQWQHWNLSFISSSYLWVILSYSPLLRPIRVDESNEVIQEETTLEEETSRVDEESYPAVEEPTKEEPAKETTNVSTADSSQKRRFKPYRGPLRSAKVKDMTESLEDMERQITMAEYMAQMPTPPPLSHDPSLLHIPSSLHSILKVTWRIIDAANTVADTVRIKCLLCYCYGSCCSKAL